MKYDVLTEKWIPGRRKDGSIESVGIRDAIIRANEFEYISTDNPQTEYGIYRLLFCFLMDAYHPSTQDDLLDIFDSGAFDATVIDNYINVCRVNGVSFDLFNEDTPFLQAGKSQWSDGTEPISIAKLNSIIPSGNNHTHFNHDLESERVMTPDQAARVLVSITAFSVAEVHGYPSTVNGAPPIYVIVKGNDLFETLLMGMVPASDFSNYDTEPPLWRWQGAIESKKEISVTSLLFGLTFPTRKIRLIISEDGLIHKALYRQGLNFIGYDGWLDPYVAYRYSDKKGRTNIKPKDNENIWLDIATLLDGQTGGAYVARQFCNLFDRRYVHIIAYAVSTNNASYIDQYRGEFTIAEKIIKSSTRFDTLQKALQIVALQKERLNAATDSFRKLIKREKELGVPLTESDKAICTYYFECRKLFFEILISELDKSEVSELNNILESWNNRIIAVSSTCYNDYVDRVCSNSKELLYAEVSRRALYSSDKKREGKK